MKSKSLYFNNIALAFVFLYFGVLAVSDAQTQANLWLSPSIMGVITLILPITTFITLFGAVEIVLAILLLIKKWEMYTYTLTALLFFGIIINLIIGNNGFDDVIARDIALLVVACGLLYGTYCAKISKNNTV